MTSRSPIPRLGPCAALLARAQPVARSGRLLGLLGSKAFFAEFLGLGRRWVAVLGPFNEHRTTDVGGLYLAHAVVLVGAAVSFERTLVSPSRR